MACFGFIAQAQAVPELDGTKVVYDTIRDTVALSAAQERAHELIKEGWRIKTITKYDESRVIIMGIRPATSTESLSEQYVFEGEVVKGNGTVIKTWSIVDEEGSTVLAFIGDTRVYPKEE